MTNIAEWIAPIATMIAAMMTAVNLGARVTGWGFVVFTIGSVAWTTVGLGSGQVSLIAANGFLTFVNLVGIWRWLGRQRAYEDGGRSAKVASRRASSPTLFTATGIAGMPVLDGDNKPLGKTVEALIECRSGAVSYVVVATTVAAGIAEQLRPVPRDAIVFECDQLVLLMPRDAFEAIVPITPDSWPTSI
ncbi:PRC-barrel domain containing protein [Novosphingobium sp. BL-52-GroH]|uniref:PRC-barrel domain containing protein n=1 Tax=Novosphingobium sp. BL-52-GroH TaxID=3349877 RepID=UPI00384E4E61